MRLLLKILLGIMLIDELILILLLLSAGGGLNG